MWSAMMLLASSLENFMCSVDPEVEMYNEGRIKFESMLSKGDYLCSTPLEEAACMWALATKAEKSSCNFTVINLYSSATT